MHRVEQVRKIVDKIILKIEDDEERRCAYVHLYGVSQICSMLSLKRMCNTELSIIAGMLHDIYSYANMDHNDHAHKGADMARSILDSMDIFDEEEKRLICTAIYNHSDKTDVHGDLDEILKDADVLQHVLYNPLKAIRQHERIRYESLREELDF